MISSSALLTENRIDIYLSQLEKSLEGVATSEKEEILREIRAHILDSVSDAPHREASLDRVFRLLG